MKETTLCLKAVAEIVAGSILEYADASGMGPWSTPESWMQCSLLKPLREKKIYVMLEARIRELREFAFGAKRKCDRATDEWLGGRIDLVGFEPNPEPSDAKMFVLVEFKKYRRYVCDSDVVRLKGLAPILPDIRQAILIVYVQHTSFDGLNAQVADLLLDIGLTEDQYYKHVFPCDDQRCAVLAIDFLIKNSANKGVHM
jgi:hypothetical protein